MGNYKRKLSSEGSGETCRLEFKWALHSLCLMAPKSGIQHDYILSSHIGINEALWHIKTMSRFPLLWTDIKLIWTCFKEFLTEKFGWSWALVIMHLFSIVKRKVDLFGKFTQLPSCLHFLYILALTINRKNMDALWNTVITLYKELHQGSITPGKLKNRLYAIRHLDLP